jgi:hypothetical protein
MSAYFLTDYIHVFSTTLVTSIHPSASPFGSIRVIWSPFTQLSNLPAVGNGPSRADAPSLFAISIKERDRGEEGTGDEDEEIALALVVKGAWVLGTGELHTGVTAAERVWKRDAKYANGEERELTTAFRLCDCALTGERVIGRTTAAAFPLLR